ncbi:MAG TPA: phosphatase PAP2 family protein, partial [Microcoleaceae cyanobacterium]
AMSSMTLVAALIILTWGSRWCRSAMLIGGIFVVTIAWTRLYLGVHFPSDILAGWMVALAWVVGVSLVIKPNAPQRTQLTTSATETTLSHREARSLRSK